MLGRIDDTIAGGALTLDVEASAREAIQDKIAAPLGLDLERAAHGILQIVNYNMMGAIRNVSVERGHDPRNFALIAFGGAGPMHAIGVARLLDMTTRHCASQPRAWPRPMGCWWPISRTTTPGPRSRSRRPMTSPVWRSIYRELETEMRTHWLDSESVPCRPTRTGAFGGPAIRTPGLRGGRSAWWATLHWSQSTMDDDDSAVPPRA